MSKKKATARKTTFMSGQGDLASRKPANHRGKLKRGNRRSKSRRKS